jgi:EAL domain-containing protein (putative c-di-GMP-specific phosphodiesterase class I)
VVRSIVKLGHALGLTMVADGVEEGTARDHWRRWGVTWRRAT